MKKYIIIALSIFSLLLTSCDKDPVVTSLSLDKSTLALSQGATGQLTATIQPATIPSTSKLGTVQWSSSNTAVATVANGIVTAVSVGTAQIVASSGSVTATCNVTVSAAVTSVTLNKTSLSLKVNTKDSLTATLLPSQSSAVASNLLWISTNPSVAKVDNKGKITAISDGTASIVASIGTVTAVCSVTVFTTIQASLTGSNYYLINVDASTAGFLGSANIAADFRADGISNNFYIWSNTFAAGTCTGTGFYGSSTSWVSLVVQSVGWSGAANNIAAGIELNKLKAVTDDTSGKYYLHFAIKSTTTNSYAFKIGYGSSAVTIVFGTAAMESTAPYGNFTRNGQWQEIEIPMSYFKNKGLTYTTGMATTDVFAMLAGGVAGTKLELDAVFIYKKP